MAFLALDLGTSFVKGAVVDADARRLDHVLRVPFPRPIPGLPPRVREYDPRDVLATVGSLLDRLLARASRWEGLVVSSQMHGLVWVDLEGRPHSSLTTWQDQRVEEPHPAGRGSFFDEMARRLSRDQIVELGNELRVGQPVGLLFRLAEQGRLPSGDVVPASLADFVVAHLCGTAPVTDLTHAMAHGLLDLGTLDWHRGAIAALGLRRVRLPEIRRHGEVVGRFRAGPAAIPCYTPAGDFQCAIAGTLLEPGELSVNVSTGSQVSTLAERFEPGDYQTRPFFEGKFLNTITHVPAGRALDALIGLLCELAEGQGLSIPDPWAYVNQSAARSPPGELTVDLAFFASSFGNRGSIANVREEDLRVGPLFRAAFESMARNYAACAQRLAPRASGGWGKAERCPSDPRRGLRSAEPPATPPTGASLRSATSHPAEAPGPRGFRRLVLSGGLAQNCPVLRDAILARFEADWRMAPAAEDTLLGLLALALAFSGRAGSVQQAMTAVREASERQAAVKT